MSNSAERMWLLLHQLEDAKLPWQVSTCGPGLYCATVGSSGSGKRPMGTPLDALLAALRSEEEKAKRGDGR